MFFAPRKAEKFSKFAKNEVKAVKVTVSATLCNVSAALREMLATPPYFST